MAKCISVRKQILMFLKLLSEGYYLGPFRAIYKWSIIALAQKTQSKASPLPSRPHPCSVTWALPRQKPLEFCLWTLNQVSRHFRFLYFWLHCSKRSSFCLQLFAFFYLWCLDSWLPRFSAFFRARWCLNFENRFTILKVENGQVSWQIKID